VKRIYSMLAFFLIMFSIAMGGCSEGIEEATPPAVSIRASISGNITSEHQFSIVVTFPEQVDTVDVDRLTATNATLIPVNGVDGDTIWTFNVQVLGPGDVSVDYPAGIFVDAYDQGNAAAQWNICFVDVAPAAIISSDVSDPWREEIAILTIDFGIEVDAAVVDGVIVTNGSAVTLPSSGTRIWRLLVTSAGEGFVTVTVPADSYTSFTGINNREAVWELLSYVPPQPEITAVVAGSTDQSPITVSIDFHDYFPSAYFYRLIFTNCTYTIASSSGTYTQWELNVYPQSPGNVSIDIPPNCYASIFPEGNQPASWSIVYEDNTSSLPWSYQTEGYLLATPLIGLNGNIYSVSLDGPSGQALEAISPSGNLLWSFPLLSYSGCAAAMDGNGVIYLGDGDTVRAVNPNGTQKWTADYTADRIAVGLDNVIYISGKEAFIPQDEYTVALNALTGETIRTILGNDGVIAVNEVGVLYIGTGDDYLRAFNTDGSLRWSLGMGFGFSGELAIGPDGTIYACNTDDNLYAVTPEGIEQWRYDAGDAIETAPVVAGNGDIYYTMGDTLYALNSLGQLQWQVPVTGVALASPTIGDNDRIYVLGSDEKLYEIIPDGAATPVFQGADSWYMDAGNAPAISDEGFLILAVHNRMIYSISTGCTGLAESAWPRRFNNNRNTNVLTDGPSNVSPTITMIEHYGTVFEAGGTLIIQAEALDSDGSIYSVTADLDVLGGYGIQNLNDLGINGDLVAGDNIYSLAAQIEISDSGSKTIRMTVVDDEGGEASVDWNITIDDSAPGAIRVNTNSPGTSKSIYPKVAVDGGTVYVVWQDDRTRAGELYFNRSWDAGLNWLSYDKMITSIPMMTNSKDFDFVCAGSYLYVIWKGNDANIYFNRSLNNGYTWLPQARRLNAEIPGRAYCFKPAITCSGLNVFCSWSIQNTAQSVNEVYFSSSFDGGTIWPAVNQRLDTDTDVHNDSIQIFSTGSTIYAMWRSLDDTRLYSNMTRSINNGATWLQPEREISFLDIGMDTLTGTIVCNGSNVLAAWNTYVDLDNKLRYNYSTNAGLTWQSSLPDPVNTPVVGWEWPSVCNNGDTVFVAGIDDRTVNLSSTTDWGVSWSGAPLSHSVTDNPVQIDAACSNQYVGMLWSDTNYMTYFLWSDDGGVSWVDSEEWIAKDGWFTTRQNIGLVGDVGVIIWSKWVDGDREIFCSRVDLTP